MKVLKYSPVSGAETESDIERRIEHLAALAKALKTEVETLQAQLSSDRGQSKQIEFDKGGIDFYGEVERYEIELIRGALRQCNGNQARAAKLLRMKSTTLNSKMKHYGLSPVRSIMVQRPEIQLPG